jgi:hypothetical protein
MTYETMKSIPTSERKMYKLKNAFLVDHIVTQRIQVIHPIQFIDYAKTSDVTFLKFGRLHSSGRVFLQNCNARFEYTKNSQYGWLKYLLRSSSYSIVDDDDDDDDDSSQEWCYMPTILFLYALE